MFPFAPEGGGGNAGHRTAATGAWLPPGAVPTGVRPPLSSSQSPLSSVSACGENCARSLAPPLPTARGAAGAPFGLAQKENAPRPVEEKKRFGGGRLALPRGSQGRKRAALGETFGPGKSGIHPAPLFAATGLVVDESLRNGPMRASAPTGIPKAIASFVGADALVRPLVQGPHVRPGSA